MADRLTSIIIPMFNESPWIIKTLIRCCDIDLRKEIVVVDNNSSDNSYDLVHGFINRKNLAKEVIGGKLEAKDIDEKIFSERLYTAGQPDPDLLIRTSGEMRVSNFLLWQISYAELYVTKKFWPDFGEEDLKDAIEEYGKRERRFGK